jgi:hypothetical protein
MTVSMTYMQVTMSPAKLTINANERAQIVANVEFSTCSDGSKSPLIFKWEQVSTDDGVTATISPALDLATVTSSSLYTPAYAFSPGSSYRLKLTITQTDDASKYVETIYDCLSLLPSRAVT